MMPQVWSASVLDYNKDVLQDHTEDELDSKVRLEAEELRLLDDDTSRYSASLDSRVSISTGLTSVSAHESRRDSLSSTFSISAQSSKSRFRRIKGLSILRFKKERCIHCHEEEALYVLSCGHRLCKQALRNLIIESTRKQTTPQCCKDIPDDIIRRVLDANEYRRCFPVETVLYEQQRAEHVRFEAWLAKTRSYIEAHRQAMITVLQAHHQTALDEQEDDHVAGMGIAEDRQVKAEADLRLLQAQEIRDNATALKHMEAYCAGTLASGEQHNRTITEQDMNELRKTQSIRDALQAKHANAINILRGEQTRRMKLRAQRYEKEVHHLQGQHRKEILAIEQQYKSEEVAFLEECNKKLQRLHARWRIETMIHTKRMDEAVVPTA